jgi:hypothetical protein
MNHKVQTFGISRIIAPNEDGHWVECMAKDDIEAGCKWENAQRFLQTVSTPFMTSPLLEDVGYLAQGSATAEALAGTYVPPAGTDMYVKKLLLQLKMDPKVANGPPMKVTFSSAEHIKGWRKAKEFTAMCPSGWTFSHFIAATFDPLLAAFDVMMANIPCATGHSLLQWQFGTNVMIPKSVASLRVDKLGTILLLHPKFNQDNKLLGRSVMSQAKAYA